jgi:hypothetical protein
MQEMYVNTENRMDEEDSVEKERSHGPKDAIVLESEGEEDND